VHRGSGGLGRQAAGEAGGGELLVEEAGGDDVSEWETTSHVAVVSFPRRRDPSHLRALLERRVQRRG
jgi:hypothetical protein